VTTLSADIDHLLKTSPVGSLLPFVLNVISNLTQLRGYSLLQNAIDILHEVVAALTSCHQLLNQLIALLPSEDTQYSDVIKEAAHRSETMESAHPYSSNMDHFYPLSFPGALSIEIVFDAASRSENGCDFLQFLNNTEQRRSLHPNIEKFSGRDGSEVSDIITLVLLNLFV
jgi:hypothetical protein